MIHWKDRFKAAGLHFCISLAIASLAALLVFLLWYPYPYRELSGGRELFFLVVTVDVILGPLITFAIFNRAKPWTELRRDLAVVALIQLCGLSYGLWTVVQARPVHMVFEYTRFRVVHAVDVPPDMLKATPAGIDALPLSGPTLLSLRPFKSNQEQIDDTLAAVQGMALSARPDLWQPYAAATADVLQVAKPVGELRARFSQQTALIDQRVAQTGLSITDLVYVPVASRKLFWTALLDRHTAQIVGYLPIDSF